MAQIINHLCSTCGDSEVAASCALVSCLNEYGVNVTLTLNAEGSCKPLKHSL
eukprot:m.233233 g.233233  ORF g.233233 m.233233 type:complete len:52 (-) comp54288_c0_seq4:83-238(-)